ncbi:hypothetical protein DSBG_1099 [Desulfosporosinus sp. BG]|nr:hypothetical protein DSBG_1099 [Desulfosporosinus sp. BG]
MAFPPYSISIDKSAAVRQVCEQQLHPQPMVYTNFHSSLFKLFFY